MKALSLALFSTLLLTSCDDKKDEPTPAPPAPGNTITVSVQENNGPTYALVGAKITATYQGAVAHASIDGKLKDGRTLALDFGQGITARANETDALRAYLAGAPDNTASGATLRNSTANTITGSFTAVFSGGITIKGSFKDQKLP